MTNHNTDFASEQPDWTHLKRYGYAPGNYMIRCRRCTEVKTDLDKRAICCKPCAEKRYAFEQLERCSCGDRFMDKCPGEWEPGCDLGNNPKYARKVSLRSS